jgi:hypothetical protein
MHGTRGNHEVRLFVKLVRTCVISLSRANYDFWIARILLYRLRQLAVILSLCTMMDTAIVLPCRRRTLAFDHREPSA